MSRRIRVSLQFAIYLRDDWTCIYCGHQFSEGDWKSRQLTLDHIVPRSQKGRDTWENLVVSCGSHNQQRASKSIEDYCAEAFFDAAAIRQEIRRRTSLSHDKYRVAARERLQYLKGYADGFNTSLKQQLERDPW